MIDPALRASAPLNPNEPEHLEDSERWSKTRATVSGSSVRSSILLATRIWRGLARAVIGLSRLEICVDQLLAQGALRRRVVPARGVLERNDTRGADRNTWPRPG